MHKNFKYDIKRLDIVVLSIEDAFLSFTHTHIHNTPLHRQAHTHICAYTHTRCELKTFLFFKQIMNVNVEKEEEVAS